MAWNGIRRIQGHGDWDNVAKPPLLSHNRVSNYLNLEDAHEHIFFETGVNIGYFPGENNAGGYFTYGAGDPERWRYLRRERFLNEALLRLAITMVPHRPYSKVLHNCQSWVEEVRVLYGLLISNGAKQGPPTVHQALAVPIVYNNYDYVGPLP